MSMEKFGKLSDRFEEDEHALKSLESTGFFDDDTIIDNQENDAIDQKIALLKEEESDLLTNMRSFELISNSILKDPSYSEEDKINFLSDNEYVREQTESRLKKVSQELYELAIQKSNS